MKRVLLSAEGFGLLVAGIIVEQDGVQVALQDIGWHVMETKIDDAIAGKI